MWRSMPLTPALLEAESGSQVQVQPGQCSETLSQFLKGLEISSCKGPEFHPWNSNSAHYSAVKTEKTDPAYKA